MAFKKLVYQRLPVVVSSSIANWKDKIKNRIDYGGDYKIFFGMYHWVDYLRFLFAFGKIKVFWAGADILQLNPIWAWILRKKKALHLTENWVEFEALYRKGFKLAYPKPIFLSDIAKYQVSFKPNPKPHIFVNCHPGREQEYGVDIIERIANQVPDIYFHIYGIAKPFHQIWFDSQYGQLHNQTYANNPNVVYHGKVSEQIFDQQIKHYQCGLRLNDFDGFGEILAKSILLGQYPISRIDYGYGISHYETETQLIALLKDLKKKTRPNPYREYWVKLLSEKI